MKKNTLKNKRLTKEKLQLEVVELQRHWITKPQYLQVLLPTTLAIFSLLYAITSGLFSSKQELLELNKKRLEADIFAFQKEKRELTFTNAKLKNTMVEYNDSLKNKDLLLKKYELSFVKERRIIADLQNEISILANKKINYSEDIKNLKEEFDTKKQKYLKEIENKYFKAIDDDKKLNLLKAEITKCQDNKQMLLYKIDQLLQSPFIEKDKKIENEKWILNKLIDYSNSQIRKRDVENEKLRRDGDRIQKNIDTLEVNRKINNLNR